jgi:hypothetical protein
MVSIKNSQMQDVCKTKKHKLVGGSAIVELDTDVVEPW